MHSDPHLVHPNLKAFPVIPPMRTHEHSQNTYNQGFKRHDVPT